MNSKIVLFIIFKCWIIALCDATEDNNDVASPTNGVNVKTTQTTTISTILPTTTTSTLTEVKTTNITNSEEDDWWGKVYEKKDMLTRALYVLAAVTTLTVLYFGIRFFSARRRKVQRYGLLSAQRETIALNPLNSDSEDDYTVFEARPLT